MLIKQNFFAFVALLLSFSLCAQEKTENEAPPGKKVEAISFQNLEFYTIQQAYEAEKKAVIIPYKSKLEELLSKYISEADALHEEQKKTGNTRGMGIARTARNLFFTAQEELATKDNFVLPEKVRKDIGETVDRCRKEQAIIMEGIDQKYKEIEDKCRTQFIETYKLFCGEGAPAPSEELLAAKFKEFLTTEIKKPEIAKKQDLNLALLEELGVKPPSEDTPTVLSPIIASKGTGTQWIDIAKWTGDMVGMDVVAISVLNQSKDYSESQYFAMANADSKLTYNAIRPMPARSDYAFRLKRVPSARDVDVIEWPSSKNEWKLIVCTRAPQGNEMIPLKHAFVFQVSLPDAEMEKVFSGASLGANTETDSSAPGQMEPERKIAPPVNISIVSAPAAAEIYLNDKLYSVKGKTVLTPCEITLPAGKCNIRISKFGYLDKSFNDFEVAMKAVVNAELEKDTVSKYYKKEVAANANTWTASGISVKVGDKIVFQVDGLWACAKKTDKCGPAGIPNTTENYKYYASANDDLRKEKSILYGALLMKLGEKGIPISVGATMKFTAKEEGELFFDINELEGKARKGNSGSLSVNVGIIAPAK